MFLHIGEDVIISMKDIIAILELDLSKLEATGEFLQIGMDEGLVEFVDKSGEADSHEKAKTFIVTTNKIYYSSISTSTLVKRAISLNNGRFDLKEKGVTTPRKRRRRK